MILGLDPALLTLGWATISEIGQVLELGLLEQERGETKNHAGHADVQAKFLVELVRKSRLVAAEALSFPKGINGVSSLCLSWGVILGASAALGVPVISVRPQQWMHAASTDKAKRVDYAVLEERLHWHVNNHGALAARVALARITPSKRNHVLDAVGVGLYAFIHRDHPHVGITT